MNIALPALFISFLLLPGILLSFAYRKGFWREKSPVTFGSFQAELGKGLLFSLLVHLPAIWLVPVVSSYSIDFEAVLWILQGSSSVNAAVIESIIEYPGQIIMYLLLTNGGAVLLGMWLHWAIRSFLLDLRVDFLRFNNPWFYTLSAESMFIEDKSLIDRDIIRQVKENVLVYAAVVVEQGGEPII
ncbi:MAG TPA: hypothetical protein VKA68_02600 [bacterium]|nr:hypothetical protein [bacterium]